jgi:hypothetical protein
MSDTDLFSDRSELAVLIATLIVLCREDWTITGISLPAGQRDLGGDSRVQKEYLEHCLDQEAGPMPGLVYRHTGPDIIASRGGAVWKIECKGLGEGEAQTLKTNFDRSVASVVSYFDDTPGLRLGLAFPDGQVYKKLVQQRLPRELRRALNLWLLWCDTEEYKIDAISPN